MWNMYQDALDVQDACTLSGVVKSLAGHMDAIWAEVRAEGKGTDEVNSHPVVIMFLAQMLHLATRESISPDAYFKADAICRQKVQGTSEISEIEAREQQAAEDPRVDR